MRKITNIIWIGAVIGLLALFACGARAQTTTNAPEDIYDNLGGLLGNLGLSSHPSNYAAAFFGGHSIDNKNQWSAGLLLVENVNANIGVCAGIDNLWGGGKQGSANIVSGGVTLKAPVHFLTFLSSDTNSWTHKVVGMPYAIAMVATPISGTGDANGGLGSILRGGFNLDIYNMKGWQLGVGGDYGSRSGSGAYNGNWIDGVVTVRKGF